MAKCILKYGGQFYAELAWKKGGGVSITESARAKEAGFEQQFNREKLTVYDPRQGGANTINPRDDKYSLWLWCAQWAQDKKRQDKKAELESEGIDFSEILEKPEPGEVY